MEYGEYTSGEFVCSVNRTVTEEYKSWTRMLIRCFNEGFKAKWPTYTGCTCSPEFYVFQSFAKWYTSQVGYSKGWHLDKDLLVRGNKVYSPETCILLPPAVNILLNHRRMPDRLLPTGVVYEHSRGKFRAQLSRNGRTEMIGRYDTVAAAYKAYLHEKDKEIKRVAELYKFELDPRAYQALINFKI